MQFKLTQESTVYNCPRLKNHWEAHTQSLSYYSVSDCMTATSSVVFCYFRHCYCTSSQLKQRLLKLCDASRKIHKAHWPMWCPDTTKVCPGSESLSLCSGIVLLGFFAAHLLLYSDARAFLCRILHALLRSHTNTLTSYMPPWNVTAVLLLTSSFNLMTSAFSRQWQLPQELNGQQG